MVKRNADHNRAFHMKMGAPLSSSVPLCSSSSDLTISSRRTTISTASQSLRRLFGLRRVINFSPLLLISLAICLGTPSCQAQSVLNFQDLNFTPWNETVSYVSSDSYNARGMAPLYQSVNDIIKVFLGKDPIAPGYIEVENHKLVYGPKVRPEFEYGELLQKYWAILLVVIIAALIIVLMPIVGLCFCCCRCAGACGGRSQPFDKKHDTCRRVIWGTLLFCAATGLLFGVIVAFVTNSYMQEGIENVTTSVRYGVDDTGTYLDSTKSQINFLLTTNYVELEDNVESTLIAATDVLLTDLKNASEAISLDYLSGLVSKLPNISSNLQEMRVLTNKLRVDASQLNDGLRGVKRELLQSLTKCKAPACGDVLRDYQIGKLDANGIDYNQMLDRYFPRLPDLTSQIEDVQKLLNGNIVNVMEKAVESFKTMSQELNKTIQVNVGKVRNAMNQAGDSIKEASDLMGEKLDQVKKTLVDTSKQGTDIADKYINEYSIYRFYFGVAVSTVLLLILLCISLALLCGICGKRPDGYGDDCCNKGSGSRFLMIAVALIFLTISVLAVVVVAHFLVGIIVQRGVCVSLRNPENDQVFSYIDKLIDLNEFYDNINKDKRISKKLSKIRSSSKTRTVEPFTLSQIIVACQNNQTIYKVLHLNNIFEIDDILDFPDKYNINGTLEHLISTIKIEDIDISNQDIAERIKELGNSELKGFQVDKFTDNLNENITNFPLDEIAQQLKETAKKIDTTNDPDMVYIQISIKNQALHLETYQQNLVLPMIENSKKLLKFAQKLDDDLHFNSTKEPFEQSIEKLLTELENAQNFIKTNGTPHVQNVATQLVNQLSTDITKYMHLIVKAVQEDIGYCAPMANVYNSLIVAGCSAVVDPFNGFWAGVGWCILLFLPTIIISVKLSSLYQKSDPYPGPLVESHWDGGPPRYQNPPMAPPASEYERPPPYYYPGASEQD
ncbi:prominin-like protein isoform X5 [Hermetia illucens]|uniref:prominin-like protein isoform X5 n=1 Tax=Hermetia illucens TaxID=343691 RepID=UPI0018CC3FCB|nr:prominin-like protein isoform X5 [Hermetia illucens]